jgi:hypothetical protein
MGAIAKETAPKTVAKPRNMAATSNWPRAATEVCASPAATAPARRKARTRASGNAHQGHRQHGQPEPAANPLRPVRPQGSGADLDARWV